MTDTGVVAQGPAELPILYRYRHLEGDHREWTRRIICMSELYFASPSSFNDPFDCQVRLTLKASRTELADYAKRLFTKYKSEWNRKRRREAAREGVKRLRRQDVVDKIRADVQEAMNRIGILSLTEDPENILMWSHYSRGHTGVCLKFLAGRDTQFFARAQRVSYSDEWVVVNRAKDSDEKLVNAILLTKAKHWEYEKEWRIIDPFTGAGVQRFPSELLQGIILGCRMPKPDREMVRKWAQERDTPLDIFDARVIEGRFALEIGRAS